jgi:sulfite exporter TauE/SafE
VGWLCVTLGAIGTVVGYGIAFESFKIRETLRDVWYPLPGILLLILGFILIDKKKMEQMERWWKRRRGCGR